METRILKRVPLLSPNGLKIDYAFKQLFGTEKNKEITVVFERHPTKKWKDSDKRHFLHKYRIRWRIRRR
ncbi:hypothetical protein KHA80_11805 [Anaerobacillus sp. HL2]|nr:hypothetical protein KHA80_11805 [Anaerobacillus sp. HL2]